MASNRNALTRADLMPLEQYAEQREAFRGKLSAHKKQRRIVVDRHAAFYFEDRLTIQYQVQEMLRIERIFSRDGIEEELAVYNPLIPDGRNLKATFMLEYSVPEERRRKLVVLAGIEHAIWMQVAGCDRVYAIADEDLARTTETKTSAVHFMRFEFSLPAVATFATCAVVEIGIEHPQYPHRATLNRAQQVALAADFSHPPHPHG